METSTETLKFSEDVLYRYEDVHYSRGVDQFDNPLTGGHIRIQLREYLVLKRTPKGAWIKGCWTWRGMMPMPGKETRRDQGERFVLLSARKRFAAETKEQALDDYKARKRRQAGILRARLIAAEQALHAASDPRMEADYF